MEKDTEQASYYTILGIEPSASPIRIKAAYRAMVQKCHPDLNPDNANITLFIALKEAYDTLSDPEKRNEYNKEKGYSYHEEISIAGSTYSDPVFSTSENDENLEQEEEVNTKVELSPDRISTAKVFSSISADSELTGLRVDQRAAMELKENGDLESGIGAVTGGWGEDPEDIKEEIEEEIELPKSKLFGFGKKISSIVSKSSTKDKRAKLKETLKERFTDEPDREKFNTKLKKPSKPRARKSSNHILNSKLSAARGQRIFEFRVSKLEAMVGAKRSLATPDRDGEPIIREVNIPPGVKNGEVLEVSWGWKSEKIKVFIDFNPFWDIRGLDIYLKLPVTIEEYFEGSELAIPCFGGQTRIRISKNIDLREPIRIQGKGVVSKKQIGDLYVMPFVSPPRQESQIISSMLDYIDKSYQNDVRAELMNLIQHPAWYWHSAGNDYLHVPITFTEAYRGGLIPINLDGEQVEIEIPKFCSAKDIIEVDFGASKLFVIPMVLLPKNLNDVNLINAAKGLAPHYDFPVRKNLPKKFSA